MQLKIALPSKGRISDPAVKLLEKAGIGIKDMSNRKLFSETYDEEISVMFTRAADIPEFVADGAADLGMTGLDLIEEKDADVEILEDLNFGTAKLVLAVPEDSRIYNILDIDHGAIVATEFPHLTQKYFKNKAFGFGVLVFFIIKNKPEKAWQKGNRWQKKIILQTVNHAFILSSF